MVPAFVTEAAHAPYHPLPYGGHVSGHPIFSSPYGGMLRAPEAAHVTGTTGGVEPAFHEFLWQRAIAQHLSASQAYTRDDEGGLDAEVGRAFVDGNRYHGPQPQARPPPVSCAGLSKVCAPAPGVTRVC